MASAIPSRLFVLAFSLLLLLPNALGRGGSNRYAQRQKLSYHGGALLTGDINVVLVWYGNFEQSTKDTVRAFLDALNSPVDNINPSVGNWWNTVQSYQSAAWPTGQWQKSNVCVVKEISQPCSWGQILTIDFIKKIVQQAVGGMPNTVAVVITAKDVTLHGTCTGKCQLHGMIDNTQPYIAVGNPEIECPESCLWPFHPSRYMPNGQVLQPPSGHAATDSIVMHLASGLAELITNPWNTGFYAGTQYKPMEVTGGICKNVFGSNAKPKTGWPGKVANEHGKSYNACGHNGHKFLLPGLWSPKYRYCNTLM